MNDLDRKLLEKMYPADEQRLLAVRRRLLGLVDGQSGKLAKGVGSLIEDIDALVAAKREYSQWLTEELANQHGG